MNLEGGIKIAFKKGLIVLVKKVTNVSTVVTIIVVLNGGI